MLTEKQFLIKRAVTVFNIQFNQKIDPDKCEIVSIAPDAVSHRGYEITSPDTSGTFRLRYYFRFGDADFYGRYILENAQSYRQGTLGDEVYVLHGTMAESWKWTAGYKFDPIVRPNVPFGSIVTEDDIPIVSEGGIFLVVETAS